jgi:hypothetical protein
VAICDALVHTGAIAPGGDGAFALGGEAESTFAAPGLMPPAPARRAYARACLDWSERRPHLAGALGAAVEGMLLERRWITRVPRTRALHVTDAGRTGLREALGLEV